MRNILLAAAIAMALPAAAIAKKAEVTCADGSASKAGRGACSHHGGVATAKKEPAKKDDADQRARNEAKEPQSGNARAENNGGILGGLFGRRSESSTPRSSTRDSKAGSPTARCKDGTMSYSAHHSGT